MPILICIMILCIIFKILISPIDGEFISFENDYDKALVEFYEFRDNYEEEHPDKIMLINHECGGYYFKNGNFVIKYRIYDNPYYLE